MNMPPPTIRRATPDDAEALAHIFTRAIRHIDAALYNDAQKAAWLQGNDQPLFWRQRIPRTQPWLALSQGKAAGFIEYITSPTEATGYIDCLYVAPDYQQTGIATALLDHILTLAREQNTPSIYTDASRAAVPFFLKHGFCVQQENQVVRHGQILLNYRMSYTF